MSLFVIALILIEGFELHWSYQVVAFVALLIDNHYRVKDVEQLRRGV